MKDLEEKQFEVLSGLEWFLRHITHGRVRAAHAALWEAYASAGERSIIGRTVGRYTTWLEQLEHAMFALNDDDRRLEVWPSENNLSVEFDAGFCSNGGPPIMVWTSRYVYFPVYGAGDSVAMGGAERNPVLEPRFRNSP